MLYNLNKIQYCFVVEFLNILIFHLSFQFKASNFNKALISVLTVSNSLKIPAAFHVRKHNFNKFLF